MPCGVGVPAQTPLFKTQKQYAGAAGEAESPDAVEMGSPLRIEWDRIRQRALSWTWGEPSDAAHQISTPHVQGTDWNRPTSGPAHSGKRMGAGVRPETVGGTLLSGALWGPSISVLFSP